MTSQEETPVEVQLAGVRINNPAKEDDMTRVTPNYAAPDEAALRAWERDYVMHHELERERVKTLPDFQSWSESSIRPDRKTEEGWIPGWSLDDCTRKWVETYGFDFPAPPLRRPTWANPGYETILHNDETVIHFDGEIAIGAVTARMSQSIYIWKDKIDVDTLVTIEDFEEGLTIVASELDPIIATLTEVRRALVASEIDTLLEQGN